jgi:hypothetical protein
MLSSDVYVWAVLCPLYRPRLTDWCGFLHPPYSRCWHQLRRCSAENHMQSMDVRRPLSGKFDSDTFGMALPFGSWRHSLVHALATGREREVAALVSNGVSNKIVAQN